MTHWKWIEELAESGIPVKVGFEDGGWYVKIAGHVRAASQPTAQQAISMAISNHGKAGAKALIELENTKRKLATLNAALKEAA